MVITKEQLNIWYTNELLTDKQIGDRIGENCRHVNNLRKKWGIKTIPRRLRSRVNEDIIKTEYLVNGLTDKQIGEKYNYSEQYIQELRTSYCIATLPTESRYYISRDELKKEYTDNKLSLVEISEKYGISYGALSQYKIRYGIDTVLPVDRREHIFPDETNEEHKIAVQIVLGTILGDGHLNLHKEGYARIELKQAMRQKEWLEFKTRKISVLLDMSEPREYTPTPSPGWNCQQQIRSNSLNSKWLGEIHPLFYDKNKTKFINQTILDMLGDIAVATWILDDGSYSNMSYTLATNCFTYDEHENMQEWFSKRYKMNPKIQLVTGREQYTLVFCRKDSENLKKIVKKLTDIIPSMNYKVGEGTYKIA